MSITSQAAMPDQATIADAANRAARLFDMLLVAGSIGAFLLAATVGALLLVVVSRVTRGADVLGLAVLMLACGLGAVGLGLVAFECGGWSAAYSSFAEGSAAARAALLPATNDAMKPFATGAVLVSMAIPVALVPPTGRVRIALVFLALVVGGLALGTSAAAYQKQKDVMGPADAVSGGT